MISPSVFGPLFRNDRYFKIWIIGLLTGVVRWLEMLAFGLYALDVTGSPYLVALLVVLRFLPLALCGVFMGALSDMMSPRRLLIIGLALIALFSTFMFGLFRWGTPGYGFVALAALLSGVVWASDLPIRRKMIGEVVGSSSLAGAMALDGAASNGMRMVGPLAGGVLYQIVGIEGIFAFSAIVYVLTILVALTLEADKPSPPSVPGVAQLLRPLRGAAEAFRYARSDKDVMRILLVTVIFNIWGFPYVSMIPVIARETLGLSPSAVGAVTALEGLFALIGAIAVVRMQPTKGLRRIYVGGVIGLFSMVLLMGILPDLFVIMFGLIVAGTCSALFAAMQSTLIYVVAPPEMRGRFLGLMTICIGTGVIGFANVGLTAEFFGAANALWIIALQGLVPILFFAVSWREMRAGQ